jgi:hypothetical protein
MKHTPKSLHWRAPEFLYKKKTLIWYMNICVFFFLVLLLFFFLKQWYGMAIIALLFCFFMSKSEERPRVVDYKLDRTGVTVDGRTIPYDEIDSFTIEGTSGSPVIVLDLSYRFSLPVTLIVKKSEFEDAIDVLLQYVPLRTGFSFIRWLTHYLHY